MFSTPPRVIHATLVFSTLLLGSTSLATAQDWAGRGRIQGIVTTQEGEPIVGAQVTLRLGSSEDAGPDPILTDEKGRWSYLGLTSGQWRILIEHPDFVGSEGMQSVRQSGPPARAKTVQLRSIQSVIDEETSKRQVALEAKLEAANSLLAEGQFEEARAEFESTLAELDDAGKPMILIAIARTYFQEGNSGQAISSLERALSVDPNHVEALRLMGSLLVNEGRSDEAAQYIARLPQGEKIDPNAILNLGIEKYNAGDMEGAVKEFELVVSSYPELPDAYYYRGLIHLNMGNNEQAISDFSKLLELAPEHPKVGEVQEFLEYLQE